MIFLFFYFLSGPYSQGRAPPHLPNPTPNKCFTTYLATVLEVDNVIAYTFVLNMCPIFKKNALKINPMNLVYDI